MIAGGAAFAGFKAFEDHQRKEGQYPRLGHHHKSRLTQFIGKTVNHQFAKELLAGFAGAEVDKLAETKGMDEYDREKAKHQAKENAQNMYDQHYGNNDQYDPNYGPPQHFQQQWGDQYNNNQY